jgi:3D (Asp-Asp-Asp) domain-containing protein
VESWGKTQWMLTSGYGNGVKNYQLVPYRTIAVDPLNIAYGTVLYVPKAAGDTITLEDGSHIVHDGYFFAGDTGGAIKGAHIDTFTGTSEENPFPGMVLSNAKRTFEAYIVTDEQIILSLRTAHEKK